MAFSAAEFDGLAAELQDLLTMAGNDDMMGCHVCSMALEAFFGMKVKGVKHGEATEEEGSATEEKEDGQAGEENREGKSGGKRSVRSADETRDDGSGQRQGSTASEQSGAR